MVGETASQHPIKSQQVKTMNNVILKLAFVQFIYIGTILPVQAMSPELKDQVTQWISNYVLSENVKSEEYWVTLLKLGTSVDQRTAATLADIQTFSPEEAVALMAYEVAQNPGRVEELTAWYGRSMRDVTRETRGITNDEVWDAFVKRMGQLRSNSNPERLRPEHRTEEYRFAALAWLLSPRVPGTMNERHMMLGNILAVIFATADHVILPLGILATKQLELVNDPKIKKSDIERMRVSNALSHAALFAKVQTKDAVLAMLWINRRAIEQGYVDGDVPNNGPKANLTRYIERILASRNFYTIDKIFEDPAKWSAPPLRVGGYVVDERWKTFKPIIEELLADPKGHNLTEVDLSLLQEALRLMPDAPFPGQ